MRGKSQTARYRPPSQSGSAVVVKARISAKVTLIVLADFGVVRHELGARQERGPCDQCPTTFLEFRHGDLTKRDGGVVRANGMCRVWNGQRRHRNQRRGELFVFGITDDVDDRVAEVLWFAALFTRRRVDPGQFIEILFRTSQPKGFQLGAHVPDAVKFGQRIATAESGMRAVPAIRRHVRRQRAIVHAVFQPAVIIFQARFGDLQLGFVFVVDVDAKGGHRHLEVWTNVRAVHPADFGCASIHHLGS